MKQNILTVAPLLPSLQAALEGNFNVFPLWQAADKAAYLKEHGGIINGAVGATGIMFDGKLMDQLPNMKIISNFGVGTDAIDLDAARKRDIRVTNTPKVLGAAVAETALALLLDVSRRITEADRFVRKGDWKQNKFPLGASLYDKKCGIVGMGNIGQTIAKLCLAFGMEVVYQGPNKKDVEYKYYADLAQMARDVDYMILAMPGGDKNRHVVSEKVLTALGPRGVLVNIARGMVVDEKALVRLLVSKKLGGAGLDVFEDEPNVPDELLKLDNVVLTPHIGSGSVETRFAMGQLVFENLIAYFSGKELLSKVV